jgi:hypothetical protein
MVIDADDSPGAAQNLVGDLKRLRTSPRFEEGWGILLAELIWRVRGLAPDQQEVLTIDQRTSPEYVRGREFRWPNPREFLMASQNEPRRVFEEISKIKVVDVILPTRTGVEIRKRCVTRPSEHQAILLQHLGLELPFDIKTPEM